MGNEHQDFSLTIPGVRIPTIMKHLGSAMQQRLSGGDVQGLLEETGMRELDGEAPVLELNSPEIHMFSPAIQVRLNNMSELQAVALLLGRPVVHYDTRTRGGKNDYYVFDSSTAYLYTQP